MSFSAEVLADFPAAYLRHGEPSGTSAADASGNGKTGTYVNTPTLAVPGALSGDADTAVSFASASSEHVTLPDLSVAEDDSFTYEAWGKVTGTPSSPTLISEGNSGSATQFAVLELNASTRKPSLRLRDDANATTSVIADLAVVADVFHHIVGVRSGALLYIYVNGYLAATPVAPPGGTFTLNRAAVGALWRNTLANYWNGTIDEAAIYPTALSAQRIADHYNAGVVDRANKILKQGVWLNKPLKRFDGSSWSEKPVAVL